MTRKDFNEKVVEPTIKHLQNLMTTKGKEYSGDDEAFRNFKEDADANQVSKYTALNIHLTKHWRAIQSFFKFGEVHSDEHIFGRIDDAINYLLLAKGMIYEDLHFTKEKTLEEIQRIAAATNANIAYTNAKLDSYFSTALGSSNQPNDPQPDNFATYNLYKCTSCNRDYDYGVYKFKCPYCGLELISNSIIVRWTKFLNRWLSIRIYDRTITVSDGTSNIGYVLAKYNNENKESLANWEPEVMLYPKWEKSFIEKLLLTSQDSKKEKEKEKETT